MSPSQVLVGEPKIALAKKYCKFMVDSFLTLLPAWRIHQSKHRSLACETA